MMTLSASTEGVNWPNENEKAVSERLTIWCTKDDVNKLGIILDQALEICQANDADIEGVTIRMINQMRIKPQVLITIGMKRKMRKKSNANANSDYVVV